MWSWYVRNEIIAALVAAGASALKSIRIETIDDAIPQKYTYDNSSVVAEVSTLSLPESASASHADYVMLYTQAGVSWAVWLAKGGSTTPPTGADYLGSDYKLMVAIGGIDSAIVVAGKVFAEVNGVVDNMTFVDNSDGTITATQDVSGYCANPVPHNADDSAGGSIGVTMNTHGAGKEVTFNSGDSTIVLAVGNWPASFIVGMKLEINTSLVSGHYTIDSILGNVITTVEALDDAAEQSGTITAFNGTATSELAYGESSTINMPILAGVGITDSADALVLPSGSSVLILSSGDDPQTGVFILNGFSDQTLVLYPTQTMISGVDISAELLALSRVFTYAEGELPPPPAEPVEPTNVVLVGTTVVGIVEVNPTVAPGVVYDDLPLPAGSLLRNTVSGKKYLAGGASETDFTEIPDVVDPAWGLAAGADDAWAILQAM